jgi:hypothetical protein
LDLADTVPVKPASMQGYLAGLQYMYSQAMLNLPWTLLDDEIVRRTLRYLKRCFPSGGGVEKTAVSVGAFKAILPLPPGWPALSHIYFSRRPRLRHSLGDRGVRLPPWGGYFLSSPGSKRPMLSNANVEIRTIGDARAVVATVVAKATWWQEKSEAFCFAAADDTNANFCPVALRISYLALAPAKARGPKAGPQSPSVLHKRRPCNHPQVDGCTHV